MKALVLGYGGSYAHETNVRNTFLEFAPDNWQCDIAFFFTGFGSTVESLLALPNVVEVFFNQSEGGDLTLEGVVKALDWWLIDNPYDLIIFSWTGYGISTLSRLSRIKNIPVFMPMFNSGSGYSAMNQPQEYSITYVNYGITSSLGGRGNRVECFDNQPNTSNATPMVAGKCAYLINQGLERAEIKSALIQSCSQYPNWDNINGYGKVPNTIPIPESFDYVDKEGNSVNFDIFEEPTNQFISRRNSSFPNTTIEFPNGVPIEEEIPTIEEEIPTIEEEIPTIEEEIPEIEPITDPTTPTVSRSQKTVTLQRNEASGQMKVFRRLKKSDEPELVATVSESEFKDTINEFGNYIYNIQYANEETESTLSEDVYVSGATPTYRTSTSF